MSFKYFAYGSNVLLPRLHAGGSKSAVALHNAKLQDHKLMFVGYNDRWKGAVATVEPSAGSHVWGVVYRLDDCDRDALDKQESVSAGVYKRVEVDVVSPDGSTVRSWTYQANMADSGKLPSPHYKHVIVQGARNRGLPTDYLDKLQAEPTNSFRGDCQVYNDVREQCRKSGLLLPELSL